MVPEGSTGGGAKTSSMMQQMSDGSIPFRKLVLLNLYDQDHTCIRADAVSGSKLRKVALTVLPRTCYKP